MNVCLCLVVFMTFVCVRFLTERTRTKKPRSVSIHEQFANTTISLTNRFVCSPSHSHQIWPT
ncbi:hypothetical protein HanRHA438_Chr14g0633411 [Helianthus annuus]|nr:hypothetical protein HanIR_Chr14g0674641 [Helianthus annuus]KAJ0852019.1 hypothetical protein HanRHA438_Chr14g0633411 [Helianthus annuus]